MILKILSTMIVILILASCANNTKPINNRIEIVDSNYMSNNIKIMNTHARKINDVFTVEAIVQNTSGHNINGYYRCKFFDADKFQIGDNAPWQLITLYSKISMTFKCQSNDISASDFKIEFTDDADFVSSRRK